MPLATYWRTSPRVPLLCALALGLLGACAQSPVKVPAPIRRLDGSTISAQDADAFAIKTLMAMHVTGAQLAVINHGQLVWTLAYGQRRKDPPLPMDLTTTTWAASITKSVFATYVMTLVER